MSLNVHAWLVLQSAQTSRVGSAQLGTIRMGYTRSQGLYSVRVDGKGTRPLLLLRRFWCVCVCYVCVYSVQYSACWGGVTRGDSQSQRGGFIGGKKNMVTFWWFPDGADSERFERPLASFGDRSNQRGISCANGLPTSWIGTPYIVGCGHLRTTEYCYLLSSTHMYGVRSMYSVRNTSPAVADTYGVVTTTCTE